MSFLAAVSVAHLPRQDIEWPAQLPFLVTDVDWPQVLPPSPTAAEPHLTCILCPDLGVSVELNMLADAVTAHPALRVHTADRLVSPGHCWAI